jgi:hypothetical protein
VSVKFQHKIILSPIHGLCSSKSFDLEYIVISYNDFVLVEAKEAQEKYFLTFLRDIFSNFSDQEANQKNDKMH